MVKLNFVYFNNCDQLDLLSMFIIDIKCLELTAVTHNNVLTNPLITI